MKSHHFLIILIMLAVLCLITQFYCMKQASQYIDFKSGLAIRSGEEALSTLWQTRAMMAFGVGALCATVGGVFVHFEHKWENIILMFCGLSAYSLISLLFSFLAF